MRHMNFGTFWPLLLLSALVALGAVRSGVSAPQAVLGVVLAVAVCAALLVAGKYMSGGPRL